MHSNAPVRTLPLLHIDDSRNDRLLVQEAISLTNAPFAFYEADAAESAIPYFQFHGYDGEPKRFPRPAVILLDYDLGNHTGADFLYWLRITKKIDFIPVVMLSGSAGRRNIAECYEMGANYFLSKPGDLARLKVIVRMLHLSLVNNRPAPIQGLQEFRPDARGVAIPELVS